MKKIKPVVHPSSYQRFTLRIMILLGAICMFFFMIELLSLSTDNIPLYWMLMLTLGFACLKIMYEWVHYLFITVPEPPVITKSFSVDIFTTFCPGEPYDMIRETLVAIQAITYPHQTYLCDEANDPYLRELCVQLGAIHVTRKLKIDAKAGNINNALKQAKGELCLILDPDHVPFPDFLDHIVAHFNNPEIGFVQVVQSYKNQDQTLIAKGAAQQTYQFYGPMMMTMNRYGTVPAIGANCTFRRTALDSIGGHAAGLAEDMHTAMQLHAKGWKSRYVPVVVARGLVPTTLSAYYSQQLKWSRGVFELLVSSYPKLFRRFTLQQKLHYGTVPVFYLSGLFYLINFLIPIFSLLFNTSPANIDFGNFLTLGLPLATAIILIRHYVQKWVMEEEERGFHLVGGLLMIGTWWIFLLGLYYTILRKVVPYIPTPKDGNEQDNWPLNRPNLVIIGISLFAVIYGLIQDYNPYNLIMSGFAITNCLILSFTIAASRQTHFRKYKTKNPLLDRFMFHLAGLKKHFWKLRRLIYGWVRETALILAVMITCFSIYIFQSKKDPASLASTIPTEREMLIAGIFSPTSGQQNTAMGTVEQLEKTTGMNFGLITLQLSWDDRNGTELPLKLIDSIYQNGSVPLIIWEPWPSEFIRNNAIQSHDKENRIFKKILEGDYDTYLDKFSTRISALNRPVFICFAPEADNKLHLWSVNGENSSHSFKAAWKYVHNFFDRTRQNNVIWVWNPGKANAVSAYFPGKEYVDWIGINILNNSAANLSAGLYDIHQIYEPYRKLPAFRTGLPVMLTEMGPVPDDGKKKWWFKDALNQIKQNYKEIKSIVFFQDSRDKNGSYSPSDWKTNEFTKIAKELKQGWPSTKWVSNNTLATVPAAIKIKKDFVAEKVTLDKIKAVNYTKDQNWEISYHTLKKSEITKDFSQMKTIGFNTIKHYGPNIYDHNILQVAKDQNLKVIYSFWLDDDIDFLTKNSKLDDVTSHILKTISTVKKYPHIIMWNIGPSPMQRMAKNQAKPDLFYYQEAYLSWLNKLSRQIKQLDPKRKISIDLELNQQTPILADLLTVHVPHVDYLGLTQSDTAGEFKHLINNLPLPYFFSKVNAAYYLSLTDPKPGVILANWQDQYNENLVTFDGLKDLYGRSKVELYQIRENWAGNKFISTFPELQIMKPAVTLLGGYSATYQILSKNKNNWEIRRHNDGMKFLWQLVKKDKYNNEIDRKELGEGIAIRFSIPDNPSNYDLYVHAIRGNQVKIIKTSLNTPLY